MAASLFAFYGFSLGHKGHAQAAPSAMPATFSTPHNGAVRVALEVANTPSARAQGLMFRRHLPAKRGMIFVFDTDARRSFWMKDTYIPLDMIFVGSHCRVVDMIEEVPPHSTAAQTSRLPAQYVIELKGGSAHDLGIKLGTKVSFSLPANEDVAKAPAPAPRLP